MPGLSTVGFLTLSVVGYNVNGVLLYLKVKRYLKNVCVTKGRCTNTCILKACMSAGIGWVVFNILPKKAQVCWRIWCMIFSEKWHPLYQHKLNLPYVLVEVLAGFHTYVIQKSHYFYCKECIRKLVQLHY